MLLNSYQKFVKEMVKSKIKIGIMKDTLEQSIVDGNYLRAAELKKKLEGFMEVNISGVGEAAVGKTKGTIEAVTEAGVAALYLNPAQWVDSADAVGLPVKVQLANGRMVTKNIARDFFPLPLYNEKNERVIREDGGYAIDFESIKDYIVNYNDLMIQYKGNINDCPGFVVIWDEFNRIMAHDVKQMMPSLMLEHRLGDYVFPNSALFVALSNPNTDDYDVSDILEERAIQGRFCHVTIENNLDLANLYMARKNFDASIIALANAHPEIVNPVGKHYDLNIKADNRSLEMVNTLIKFTDLQNVLTEGELRDVFAGLLGNTYVDAFMKTLKDGVEKVPTGEEIVTQYDEVRSIITKAVKNNREDILYMAKANFTVFMIDTPYEELLEKYNLKAEQSSGEFIIPPNLDNIYKFFVDIPADYQTDLITLFVTKEHIHINSILAPHDGFHDLILKTIEESRRIDN